MADAINRLWHESPIAAARVLAALPFDLAVRVLGEPELEHTGELFRHIAEVRPSACTSGMSARS